MLENLVFVLGGYLLGSIPFAYLIVRERAHIDIRDTGSGSAGGFNAYLSTHSGWIGAPSGCLDALKGFSAVFLAGWLVPGSYFGQALALIGAIAGHNYPIWTEFKGGRGLATTAGGMFTLGLSYAIVWCTVWLLARLLKRDILSANLFAILLTPPLLWLLPWEPQARLILAEVDRWSFVFFSCIISTQLLLSHVDAMRDIWKGPSGQNQESSST